MDSLLDTDGKGFEVALKSARNGDIHAARIALGLVDKYTDDELLEALIGLSKAIELFTNQRHVEAADQFQKALPIIESSGDEEAKYIVSTMSRFAEGLSALFGGDAHEAVRLLNLTSETVERISFFMPGFEIASFSYKAASLIALGRLHLNAAQISSAEEAFGKAKQCHDELLKILDPTVPEHALAFAEVYATRFELASLFVMMMDLPTLDLSTWKKRLETSRKDVESLNEYVVKIPKGPIQILMSQYPIIFSVLETFQRSLEISTVHRRPFKKTEVEALVNSDIELFNARRLVQGCGERGRGLLFQIDQLKMLQKNILQFGNAATKDFGRFSGFISLFSLVLLIIVLHFTIEPTGYLGVIYYFGALILSLIVGFGFGALRFQPLLKMFSEAMIEKPNTDK